MLKLSHIIPLLIGAYLIFVIFFFPKDLSTKASTMEPSTSKQESAPSNQPAESSTKESTVSNEPERMPAFFIGHGGPTLVAEKGPYIDYLKRFRKTIPKPEAIIIFSAHWEESTQTIGYVFNEYPTIYDFSGFPSEFYKMKYPAPGAPKLAQEVHDLLKKNGIKSQGDFKRGLDHGAWTVLKLMYPEADIPVVSMSVNTWGAPEEMYKIGLSLAPLRERGVLIIGSGATVHNFGMADFSKQGNAKPAKFAKEFNDWLDKQLKEWNTEEMFNYAKKAPNVKIAVPRAEHFIPLIYAMGAGGDVKKTTTVQENYVYGGGYSYMVWRFD